MRRVTILASIVLALTVSAMADPLTGETLKFVQLPMIDRVINDHSYFGHDEISTATAVAGAQGLYVGNSWMADDFADYNTNPVVHVQWWGSYVRGQPGTVPQFLIEFLSDNPVGPAGNFSRPLAPILTQIVTAGPLAPGSGTFTETLAGGGAVEPVYQYNAELKIPFQEIPKTVYWLKIVALTPSTTTLWGWHNRDYTIKDPLAAVAPDVVPGEFLAGVIPGIGVATPIWHFQDDAVQGSTILVGVNADGTITTLQEDLAASLPKDYLDGTDGPGPVVGTTATFPGIGTFSKDLAFALYTVPEPATMSLLVLGGLALLRRKARR